MTKHAKSLLAAAALLFAASLARADERILIAADIPLAFEVAGNSLPAGHYAFAKDDVVSGSLILRNVDTGKAFAVAYNSRLAMRPDSQAAIVFDKQGDKEYLSEIHLAGDDGYYFTGAMGKHTHVTVKAAKKN